VGVGVDVGAGVCVAVDVAVAVAVAVAVDVRVLVKVAPGVALAEAWTGTRVAGSDGVGDTLGAVQATRTKPRHRTARRSHIVAGLFAFTR